MRDPVLDSTTKNVIDRLLYINETLNIVLDQKEETIVKLLSEVVRLEEKLSQHEQ